MMRFLSSEGWKEKSKPASVLMVEGDLDAAILAQGELLGEQASIASSAVISRRSRRRTVASRISMARGILRATIVCLMRSTTEGTRRS
jgi:hypothetical protein